jgi:FkbM family methyltransferase
MGNGADKIMNIMSDKGIEISGVFASDEFVRGHSFRGFRVQKLSEVEAETAKQGTDFIAVPAFGSDREDVIKRFVDIAARHTLIMPDVPLYGNIHENLFTYEFYKAHADEFEQVYSLFSDDYSRKLYESIINYKISGKIDYLIGDGLTVDFAEIFDTVSPGTAEIYADCGAYTGDTIAVYHSVTSGKYRHIHAFEPGCRTFKRLENNTAGMTDITLHNAAVWSEASEIVISDSNNRNNTIVTDIKDSTGGKRIRTVTLDEAVPDATLVKMDVEGAEPEALTSAESLLRRGAKFITAIYHRSEDLYKLPLLMHRFNPQYRFCLRRIRCVPAWDVFLCTY